MSANLTNVNSNGKHKPFPIPEITPPILDGQLKPASEFDNSVAVGGSVWNAYNLYKTLKKVETSLQRIQFLRQQIAHPIQLIALTPHQLHLLRERCRNEIRSHEEFIRRCYLKVANCGLHVIKVSSILITNPYLRKGFEGTINAAANSSMMARELTTQTREQLLTPRTANWKDKAHKFFNISVATIGLTFGILTLAVSLGYVDEEDAYFKMVKTASITSTVSGAVYGGLQFAKILAQRD